MTGITNRRTDQLDRRRRQLLDHANNHAGLTPRLAGEYTSIVAELKRRPKPDPTLFAGQPRTP